METEKELVNKIMMMTTQIQESHPELSKYIDEMPVTIPNESSPEINMKILREYLESLETMLKKNTDTLASYNGTSVLPSHPRPDPDRPLDGHLLDFDLPAVIDRIKQEADWISGKHNAITLMKSNSMRIVLIAMHEGNEMKMHQAAGPVSIYLIEGKLELTTENESVILHKNQLVTLHENIKHGLLAIGETILLLTIVNCALRSDVPV